MNGPSEEFWDLAGLGIFWFLILAGIALCVWTVK